MGISRRSPRDTPIGAEFSPNIKETGDHVTAVHGPSGGLAGGLKRGTFAQQESGPGQGKLLHFRVVVTDALRIQSMGYLNLHCCRSAGGLECDAAISRVLKVHSRTKILNVGLTERRR